MFETGEGAPELLEDKKQQGDLIAKGCREQRNLWDWRGSLSFPGLTPIFVSTLEWDTINLEANMGAINPGTQFLGFFAPLPH